MTVLSTILTGFHWINYSFGFLTCAEWLLLLSLFQQIPEEPSGNLRGCEYCHSYKVTAVFAHATNIAALLELIMNINKVVQKTPVWEEAGGSSCLSSSIYAGMSARLLVLTGSQGQFHHDKCRSCLVDQ